MRPKNAISNLCKYHMKDLIDEQKEKGIWQPVDSAKVWSDFLGNNPQLEANFTQNFNWGLFHERLNAKIFRRGFVDKDGILTAGYTAVLEVGRFYRFLTIAGGPLIDWRNPEMVESFKADVENIGRQNGCFFVRIRPQAQDSPRIRLMLKRISLMPAPAGLSVEFAGILKLDLSDEQLLSNMSQSLRRKIRKAQSDKKIQVRVSKAKKDALLFAELHQEHAQIQNYMPFSEKKLVCQFETFANDDQALLYIASREGKVLAAIMIFFYGQEASYHYGISTQLGQKYSAAPLLHLEAIAEAKRRQLKIYNFWGIVAIDQTKHRYFGLSQFKRSFGVEEYKYVPAHDLILKTFAYVGIWIFETLRRKRRRL